MFPHLLAAVACLYLTLPFGEGIKCYHCYDSFNKAVALTNIQGEGKGGTFIRCDKNQNKWNSWDCPAQWPVCVIVSATVKDHYEVVRTCAEKSFCSTYVPSNGVKMDSCQECNTTLCNDYVKVPDPPVYPGPLFTFNINLHLNVKRYPVNGINN